MKNFLSGKPVDYENFREICDRLGLDWQAIVYTDETTQLSTPEIEASPFITGTPILHPRYFFGRERQLKRCFALLKHRPLQNIAIIGPRRIGKTSFLHYLSTITTTPTEQLRPGQKQDWLPYPELYRWVFVDFQDSRMSSQNKLLGHLLKSFGLPVPEGLDLDLFMDLVSRSLQQPTVVLLDEIGVGLKRCPELDEAFWESLRSLATNHTGGNLAFILSAPDSPMDLAHHSGWSSPFFNIFGYTTTLGPMSMEETHELIASSPIPFSLEDRDWICRHSHHFPLLIQILCYERLFALESRDADDVWKSEGLKQIEPFLYLLD